jgi:putative DNA primase/helicase
MERIDFSNLDWYAVLTRMGVPMEFIQNPRRLGPCPIEGDGRTRFRFDNKGGKGTWICNHCGSGDGVDLVAALNECSNAEAVRLIRDVIGGNAKPAPEFVRRTPVKSFTKTPQEIEKARSSLMRAWEKAKSIAATGAARYLGARINGIDLGYLAPSFKYHPSLYHFDEGTARKSHLPCLLSRVVDASNPSRVVTLHRTYITENGTKAKVSPDQVKKLMAATVEKIGGESIKLNTAVGPVIIVTEGIEGGLAWVMACKNRYPVYSAINCGNLAKFKWPEGTKSILIASDHDPVDLKTGLRPGPHNAFLLKERAMKEGLSAIVKIPPAEGVDWDDLWNLGDLAAFRIKRKHAQPQQKEVAA